MRSPRPLRQLPVLLILAIALLIPSSPARAHDESASSIEARLHGLEEDGAITEVQHRHIEELYFNGHASELDAWLNAQALAGAISSDTHIYLNAMLGLGEPDVVALAPVPGGARRRASPIAAAPTMATPYSSMTACSS